MKNGEKPTSSREEFEKAESELADLELDLATTPEGIDTSPLEISIARTKERLKGMLTVAQREAKEEDVARELAQVAPELDRAVKEIDGRPTHLAAAPAEIRRLGEDTKGEIELLRRIMKGAVRPAPQLSAIEECLAAISEGYRGFIFKSGGYMEGQDRYGKARPM